MASMNALITLVSVKFSLLHGEMNVSRQTDIQPDRQTEKCIKINQSFVIAMSLNSDPKETCAKT